MTPGDTLTTTIDTVPVSYTVVAAPPSVGARTARAIPGARLTVIQAASHFAHYEKPGPVTDALLTHFRSTVAGA